MASNVVLKFDPVEIRSAAQKLNNYSSEMHEIQKQLKETLRQLREKDWRGKAADKLAKEIGEDWSETVDRYCDLMKLLTEIMNDASNTYNDLWNQAKQLRLDR